MRFRLPRAKLPRLMEPVEQDLIDGLVGDSPKLSPLETVRHSTAHVMAKAVQRLFPETKVTAFVTQARSSLPGGIPCVALPRRLMNTSQSSFAPPSTIDIWRTSVATY